MHVASGAFYSGDIHQSRRFGRTATLAFAIAVGMIPVLYFFTSTADGAEPGSKSSLKWRAAGNRPAAVSKAAETQASDTEPAVEESAEAKSAEPKALVADADAKPISVKGPVESAKRSTEMRRDNEVRLTQATNPLSKPIDDPFGDKKSGTPAPRLLEPKSAIDANTSAPPLPSADQLAINNGGFQQEECPKLSQLKPISQISNVIAASQGDLPRECYFDESVIGPMNRNWMATTYTWKASGLCHKPLYFEEVALERYGHSTGPISQPIVSGAHFFATLPLLPYKMGLSPPWECKYALGYYRPGSCAPYIVPPIPISGRAIAAEAAAVTGVIFLFP